jgi:hypothetical protein
LISSEEVVGFAAPSGDAEPDPQGDESARKIAGSNVQGDAGRLVIG